MSATINFPEGDKLTRELPRHVAIVMDGNGRWAKQRKWIRHMGHKAGVKAVKGMVESCAEKGIEVLTLFAFSSENWRRPRKEVGLLMELFYSTLQQEVAALHKNNVRLRFIGNRGDLPEKLVAHMYQAETTTGDNTGLTLVVAANYGGRQDIMQAVATIARRVEAGELRASEIDEDLLARELSLADLPEPDLFIRTGGEKRISNFLMWQLAYTELYFTETLWPDFDRQCFDEALTSYTNRQRRFGLTGEQVEHLKGA